MRTAMTCGILVGMATAAWMFAEYALGFHEAGGIGRWTGFVALIFLIAGAYLLARREHLPSYGRAAALGAAFGATGGIVNGVAIYGYFAWLNPGFTYDGQPTNAVTQAVSAFVGAVILGTLLVIVVRALRRQKEAL